MKKYIWYLNWKQDSQSEIKPVKKYVEVMYHFSWKIDIFWKNVDVRQLMEEWVVTPFVKLKYIYGKIPSTQSWINMKLKSLNSFHVIYLKWLNGFTSSKRFCIIFVLFLFCFVFFLIHDSREQLNIFLPHFLKSLPVIWLA